MTNAAAAPPPIRPPWPPDFDAVGATPVSGAPFGTTATCAGDGARVGLPTLGTGDGVPEAGRVVGTALGAALGVALPVGAWEGAAVAVGRTVGTGLAPLANAGTVLASTAVHASAMVLRTVRRMNRSLSSVRPPGDPAG
jgi:hypothetical protein